MGNCIFCGKPAGFLRSMHKECEQLRTKGEEQIIAEVLRAIKGTKDFIDLESTINNITKASFISEPDKNNILIHAWGSAVDQCLVDTILDSSEEKRLVDFSQHFSLSQSDLDKRGAFTKVKKAAVLRNILNGILPQPGLLPGNMGINLQKNEQLVWSFSDVEYLEDRTRRQYVGGSHGVSIRVLKGVYYNVGAFKGHPIEYTERTYVDSGWVLVTNKHIYFSGSSKSLRVPYTKIITFLPFENGFGIMRDAATAKPQLFVVGDGWFAYNLVTNLAQL